MPQLERDGLGEDEVRRCVKKVPGLPTLLATSQQQATRAWEGKQKNVNDVSVSGRPCVFLVRTVEFLELIYTTIDWPLQTPNLKVVALKS